MYILALALMEENLKHKVTLLTLLKKVEAFYQPVNEANISASSKIYHCCCSKKKKKLNAEYLMYAKHIREMRLKASH